MQSRSSPHHPFSTSIAPRSYKRKRSSRKVAGLRLLITAVAYKVSRWNSGSKEKQKKFRLLATGSKMFVVVSYSRVLIHDAASIYTLDISTAFMLT